MRQFRTVLKYEYTNYVKTKGYILSTAFIIAAIIIITCFPTIAGLFKSITGGGETAEPDILSQIPGITGEANGSTSSMKKALLHDPQDIYTDQVLAAYLPGYTFTRVDYMDNAKKEIEDGNYDLAIYINGLKYTLYEEDNMFTGGNSAQVSYMVKEMYQLAYLNNKGLNPVEAAELLHIYPEGNVVTVGRNQMQGFWFSYIMLFMTFFVTIMYGQFVSTSVAVEKSSKAMELLITSAKPFQLMLGKVLGVGLAGLTQFALIVITTLVSFRLNYDGWMQTAPMVASVLDISLTGSVLAYVLIFFVFSFFSFSFILAGFACTVSRMEEVNTVVLVPMLIFVAAFYVAMSGSMLPDATYVTVTSFIPYLSPMVMLMRICTTEVPFVQILIAICINTVTVLGSAFICSRIYRIGVMLYGNKPKLKDIFRYIIKA